MPDKLCILVCEFFGKEAAAVIESEGFDDVAVATFPAWCGRPQLGWDALDQAARAGEGCGQVHVLGGCCIAGLEDSPKEPVRGKFALHKLEQCFYLFAGRELIDNYLRRGAYLLTPGWAARWRHWVNEWGFGNEQGSKTAQELFGEFATQLLLLDTGVDPKSPEHLREFAGFTGLPYSILPVGLDFFQLFLAEIVLEWRLENERGQSGTALNSAQRRVADYATALDLLSSLARTMTECEAITNIFDLFTMLFAPGKLLYVPLEDEKPIEVIPCGTLSVDSAAIELRLAKLQGEYTWAESGNGFLLRIGYRNETLGVLEVDEVTFPEYKEHYLNLALTIADVCGLAISNARTYQQIKQAEEALRELNATLEAQVAERTAELQQRAVELERTLAKLRETQEQLVRSERLAAIGELAASVAHELRNPLSVIRASAYYLKRKLLLRQGSGQAQVDGADDRLRGSLEQIEKEIRASDRIIRDLLEFAQARTPELRPADVNEIVRTALAAAALPGDVTVVTRLAEGLPLAPLDSHQLERVFLNLITNAIQAMPEGGRVTITTELTKSVSIRDPQSAIRIQVSDTGVGIPSEDQARIFEPLFTTKVHGTGLGLSICRRIVEAHGGSIEVESPSIALPSTRLGTGRTGRVEEGSTFIVRLPVSSNQ